MYKRQDQDVLGKNNQTNQYVNLCVKYDSNFKVEFIETGEIPNHTDIILQDDAGKITDGKIELVRFAGDLIEPVTNPIGGEINTRINKYDCQGYPELTKDVYKRQQYGGVYKYTYSENKVTSTDISVSYTHLDVYKRQYIL